ncbi:MAG: type II secretion system GspH family protein [Methylacidiphilales bacterium]|nr:type II secretion system GspH family protein [Candidatus Methylacidiphilales bacterium]
MIQPQSLPRATALASFTLVEVVVALGIFCFVLAALAGMFTVGIQNNKDSNDQIQAANLASLLITTRRSLPTNTIAGFALPPLNVTYSSSGSYLTNASGVADDGTSPSQSGTVTPTYNLFYQAGTNAVTGSHLAQVHLMLWWPLAAAMPTNSNNPGNHYELTTLIALP